MSVSLPVATAPASDDRKVFTDAIERLESTKELIFQLQASLSKAKRRVERSEFDSAGDYIRESFSALRKVKDNMDEDRTWLLALELSYSTRRPFEEVHEIMDRNIKKSLAAAHAKKRRLD